MHDFKRKYSSGPVYIQTKSSQKAEANLFSRFHLKLNSDYWRLIRGKKNLKIFKILCCALLPRFAAEGYRIATLTYYPTFCLLLELKLSICIFIEFLYCTCNTNDTKIFIIEAGLMYKRPAV